MFTLGVLTSSDMGAEGLREDTSGQAIKEIFLELGFSLARYEVSRMRRRSSLPGWRSGRQRRGGPGDNHGWDRPGAS